MPGRPLCLLMLLRHALCDHSPGGPSYARGKPLISYLFSLETLTFGQKPWYYDIVVRNMRFLHAILAR